MNLRRRRKKPRGDPKRDEAFFVDQLRWEHAYTHDFEARRAEWDALMAKCDAVIAEAQAKEEQKP